MKTPNAPSQFIGKTQHCVKTLLWLILLLISSYSFSQTLAFPSAEGFGKNATGGRGGQVIKVTNLNDSGTGSFRAALDASGTRTVVFEVGGIINLNSNIYVDNGNLTIAGQTAPGDGILIRGGMVQFEESNVIVRYIKFRPGPTAPNGYDAVSITAWSGQVVENVVFDHCSFSWGDDENFDIRGVNSGIVRNITLQNSIISENTYGLLASGCYNISIYRNLFALNSERNIRSNYPESGELDFEMINNLVYGFRAATKPSLGVQFSVLNNHYKLSSQVNPINDAVVDASSSGGGIASQTHAYISGNIKPNSMSVNDSDLNPYLETTNFASSGIVPISASELENALLDNVGASYPTRDAVDSRIINHYNAGNGVISSSGTYPTISNGTALADSDNDGMPNTWEIENGLNINDASDRNIVQADGYTNLEYYLNFMTLGSTSPQVVASSDVSICQGETTTLTASGADTYNWMPGNITSDSIDVNPTTDTTYTVTGSHSDGSTSNDEVIVTVNSTPVANAGNDVETCQGTAVTLTATGGTNYLWNTGATTQSISVNPNTTTTYSVETIQNGCTSELDDVIVTVNALPNVDAGLDTTINFGDNTTLTANGADTYLWNTGATTQSITVSPTTETTFSVIGTTGSCQNTDYVTVFLIGSEVVANAGNNQTICNGSQTTLTATGGVAYVWNTGATTASINVSPASTTTYTVTAYDTTGTVSDSDSVMVTVNSLPLVNAGSDVTITEGESTMLTASGADGYLWNTGATTSSISVNPTSTTTYSVTGFTNDCEATDEITVTVETETIVANAGVDVVICEGESTILTATGGTTYEWNTGATTASIEVSPSVSTSYVVTAYNASGTISDADVVLVTVNALPLIDAGTDVTITEGESTMLTASGADSYLWNTGATTSSISVNPTSTTTYSVTGFTNGCEATDDITVTVETETIVANAGVDVVICEGESTILTATGGTTYEWNTGATTASIEVSPSVSTSYVVTAYNASGTISDADVVLVSVNSLPLIDAGTDVTITEGESTMLTASGADTYLWNTGATTSSISVNPTITTTYSVTGFTNDCEATDEITVTVETENIVANAGVDVVICEGESTILTATGGTTYEWNTGATTASIEVSPSVSTSYVVTAYNASGTISDADVVLVTVNALPLIDAGTDVTITEGESTILTASGADSYLWNTGATTSSISVNPTSTTTYSVTGFTNGCEATDEITVTVETETIVANAGVDVVICEGESTILTATGGTTYEWNTGATTPSIEVSPNSTTTYSVTAYNTSGSISDSDDVIVMVNELPNVNAGNDVEICQGSSITLTASGGSVYLWNTGATTASINVSPNSTTVYSVEVFQNNCSNTDEVIVTVSDLPEVYAGEDVTITEGESTILTASGAESYIWNTGETTQSIEVNPGNTTTYSVIGFTNSCEGLDEVLVIVEPNVFTASAGEDQSICEGSSTILTASDGEAYLWSTGETTQSIEVNPWASETYTVTVYEGDEQAEDDVTVFVNLNPEVVIMNGGEVTILEGEFITLSASGANTYEWDNGATQPNIAVSPSFTSTYSVTGYINNCSDNKSVTVNVVDIVEAYAGEDQFICLDEVITLTAEGGEEYLWNTGETTQSIEVSPEFDTEYSVLVYNALSADEAIVNVFVDDCTPDVITPDEDEFDVLIFQDVSADVVKVQISGLDRVDVDQIVIYDLTGKVIYSEKIRVEENMQSLDKEISSSEFSRGIYVVRLIYDDTDLLKKIPIR